MLSRRSRVDLAPNRLARVLGERARRGAPHLDLTVSNPTIAGLPSDDVEIGAALAAGAAHPYEPAAFGLWEARDAAADVWRTRGVNVDASRVALTASTSEAYAHVFKLLCDPGESVLVPRPSYPLFEHLARYEAVQVETYPVTYDGAWHLDVPALVAAVTPRCRAIVLVSPNNPTGSFVKRDELRRVAALGLPLISDEVFGAYGFGADEARAATSLEAEDTLVFALDGLSKLACLPHVKVAWITVGGPPALADPALAALELLLDTFLSPSGPAQRALPRLLDAGAVARAAVRERSARNLGALTRAIAGGPVTCLAPEGGWYATLRLPRVRTEEDWTLGLLEEEGVLVQPGWFYDFPDEGYLVVSLLTPEREFADGVGRLSAHVQAHA